MFLWRISNHPNLNGGGGLETSACWHTRGRPIVYLAESVAGALLEVLVRLELNPVRLPKAYRLINVGAPDDVSAQTVSASELVQDWVNDGTATRTVGDEWLASKSTALLRVPSAVIPETFNMLLNSEHSQAQRLRILWHREYRWDSRLILR
jgi:RES domain-containing protein